MDRKVYSWLMKEWPIWKEKEWITDKGKRELRAHYEEPIRPKGPSALRLFVIALGLGLVLLGVFLILAGEWYSFSPNGRADWAMFFLALSLAIVGLAIWKAPRGSAVAELSSLQFFLFVGLTAFLVGDSYYVEDSGGLYLLATMGFGLVAAYLLASMATLLLYLAGVVIWSFTANALYFPGGAELGWLLLFFALPLFVICINQAGGEIKRITALSWMFLIALFSVFFCTLQSYDSVISLIYISAFSTILFLAGQLWSENTFFAYPLRWIGTIGSIYVAFKGSFSITWLSINAIPSLHLVGVTLAFLLIVFSSFVFYRALERKKYEGVLIGLGPIMTGLCSFLVRMDIPVATVTLIFVIYVIVLAVSVILQGSVKQNITMINAGLVFLLLLVIARLFDTEFTFFERGFSFIAVGSLLIVLNGLYMWNKKRRTEAVLKERRKQRERSEIVKEDVFASEEEEPAEGGDLLLTEEVSVDPAKSDTKEPDTVQEEVSRHGK